MGGVIVLFAFGHQRLFVNQALTHAQNQVGAEQIFLAVGQGCAAGLAVEMLNPGFGALRIRQVCLIQNMHAGLVVAQSCFVQQRVGAGSRHAGVQHFDDYIGLLYQFGQLFVGLVHMSGIPGNSHGSASFMGAHHSTALE